MDDYHANIVSLLQLPAAEVSYTPRDKDARTRAITKYPAKFVVIYAPEQDKVIVLPAYNEKGQEHYEDWWSPNCRRTFAIDDFQGLLAFLREVIQKA